MLLHMYGVAKLYWYTLKFMCIIVCYFVYIFNVAQWSKITEIRAQSRMKILTFQLSLGSLKLKIGVHAMVPPKYFQCFEAK